MKSLPVPDPDIVARQQGQKLPALLHGVDPEEIRESQVIADGNTTVQRTKGKYAQILYPGSFLHAHVRERTGAFLHMW